jgi:hypothetical protein
MRKSGLLLCLALICSTLTAQAGQKSYNTALDPKICQASSCGTMQFAQVRPGKCYCQCLNGTRHLGDIQPDGHCECEIKCPY